MAESIRGPEARGVGLVNVDIVRESRSWFVALGVALVVLGGLSILLPFAAGLVTTFVLGCLLLVGGVVQGFHALQNRRWGGSGWAIVGAVVYLIAGVLVVAFPVTGTLTLTLVLAAYFVAQGIVKIIRAFQHRTLPAWGWLLFDGIVSLVLGVLIWMGWPSTAAWALGLLVGIELIFGGTSMLLLGLTSGTSARARL